jgi:hypothetical protein
LFDTGIRFPVGGIIRAELDDCIEMFQSDYRTMSEGRGEYRCGRWYIA